LPEGFSEYIDLGSGLKRVAGSQAVFLKLLKSFLSGGQTEKLKEQIRDGNIAEAAATAHGIKGVAGNLSLTKLYEAMTRFEAGLKRGEVEDALREEAFDVAARTEAYIRTLVEIAD
jgi:HPt (histidine-containing phosphotransfer) domain-containing protein